MRILVPQVFTLMCGERFCIQEVTRAGQSVLVSGDTWNKDRLRDNACVYSVHCRMDSCVV